MNVQMNVGGALTFVYKHLPEEYTMWGDFVFMYVEI